MSKTLKIKYQGTVKKKSLLTKSFSIQYGSYESIYENIESAEVKEPSEGSNYLEVKQTDGHIFVINLAFVTHWELI